MGSFQLVVFLGTTREALSVDDSAAPNFKPTSESGKLTVFHPEGAPPWLLQLMVGEIFNARSAFRITATSINSWSSAP